MIESTNNTFLSQLANSLPCILSCTNLQYFLTVDTGTLLRVVKPRLVFSECGKTLVKVEKALEYLMTRRKPHLVVNNYKHLHIDVRSNHFNFKELLREIEPHFKPAYKFADPNNPLFILFTSGTTGTPKGAMISERFFTNSEKFL